MTKTRTPEELFALLINLRRISNQEVAIHQRILSGELTKLAPWVAVSTHAFRSCHYLEKRILKILAQSLSSYRAVVIGRSAAVVRGIWTVNLTRDLIELALPSGNMPEKKRWWDGVIYRRATIPPSDIGEASGVRTTSPLRTFLDIARHHGFLEGLIAADYLRRNNFSSQHMQQAFRTLGRVRNAQAIRDCILWCDPRSGSPYESLLRGLLIQIGETGFTLQYQVLCFFVDIMFLEERLAIEVDGDEKYDEETYGVPINVVLKEERDREKAIQNEGFLLLRFSPRQIREEPDKVIAIIQSTLASRRAQLNLHSA